MSREHDDLELEPIPGLPRSLPPGEEILWQGRPSWRGLAGSPFHVGWLALYLGAVVAARGIGAWGTTHRLGAALIAAGMVLPLALVCLGLVVLLAVLHARATVYTITSKRIVMRFGVALPMSFNVPFRRIASADVRTGNRGEGDIVLRLAGPDRLNYAHLWPHVRPWRFRRAEPMLRAVPRVTFVSTLLARAVEAWSASDGAAVAVAEPPAAAVEPRSAAVAAPPAATLSPALGAHAGR